MPAKPHSRACTNCHKNSVRFDEDDLGAEEFCSSCGKVNFIPLDALAPTSSSPTTSAPTTSAAKSPPARPDAKKPSRVFGHNEEFEEREAGSIQCSRCNHVFSYNVADIGNHVYCPSCQLANYAGPALENSPILADTLPPLRPQSTSNDNSPRRSSVEMRPITETTLTMPGRRIPLRAMLLTSGILLLFVGLGIATGWGGRLPSSWNPWATTSPEDNMDDPETVESADKKTTQEKTTRNDNSTPQPNNNRNKSNIADSAPRPDARAITLAMIEELAHSAVASTNTDDWQNALIKAQDWQMTLNDHSIAATDPRQIRLRKLIDELTHLLTPKAGPPPTWIKDFRKILEQLRVALAAERLPDATTLALEGDRLLNEHPVDLAPYSRSFLAMKSKLAQLQARKHGVAKIRATMEAARAAAESGATWSALEAEARAKFLARVTELEKIQVEEFENYFRQTLAPLLLWARGRQAVEDAARCVEQRDITARDRCLAKARSLLPGLPDAKVAPLMARVRELAQTTVRDGKQSPFGKELEVLELYARTLDFYSRDQLQEMVVAAVETRDLAIKYRVRPDIESKLLVLFTEVTQFRLQELMTLPDRSPHWPDQLTSIRKALDSAKCWKDRKEWKTLDAILRDRGEKVAQRLWEQATALAQREQFDQAMDAATKVEALATSDLAARAKSARIKWQEESARRANAELQRRDWQDIERLVAERRTMDAWHALRTFEKRYPTAHKESVAALRQTLEPAVRAQVERLFSKIVKYQEAENWVAMRAACNTLESIPLNATDQDRLTRYLTQLEQLGQRADGRFAELRDRAGVMVSEEQIIEVIEGMTEVLALNPDHEDAKNLLAKAERLGAARAEKLYQAAVWQTKFGNPKGVKDRLERTIQLNPHGPWGQKAQDLLNKG